MESTARGNTKYRVLKIYQTTKGKTMDIDEIYYIWDKLLSNSPDFKAATWQRAVLFQAFEDIKEKEIEDRALIKKILKGFIEAFDDWERENEQYLDTEYSERLYAVIVEHEVDDT